MVSERESISDRLLREIVRACWLGKDDYSFVIALSL